MELALNLAWALLAISFLAIWSVFAPCAGVSRGKQLVALAVLILVLFPVISITDDLLAAQNPAETDCCLRKDQAVSGTHSIFPSIANLPLQIITEFALNFTQFAAPGGPISLRVDHPGLTTVQNRPPPVA